MSGVISLRTGAAIALCGVAGCGGGSGGQSTPGPGPSPTPRTDEQIIRAWVDELRAGRVEGASRYFSIPSTAANGTPPMRLRDVPEVRAFNGSLPCGARLVRTVKRRRHTIGVFVLTDRPGGDCGSGVGHQAATAFLIRDGKIVEWLRVDVPPPRSQEPDRRAPTPEPGAPPNTS